MPLPALCGFQFTHPGKGATVEYLDSCVGFLVSIHAPWEGCDGRFGVFALETGLFQFTHPGKGATTKRARHRGQAERFNSRTLGRVRRRYQSETTIHQGFNSRTLGRVRQRGLQLDNLLKEFQFTHPGKGATVDNDLLRAIHWFQFTHPGKGAT